MLKKVSNLLVENKYAQNEILEIIIKCGSDYSYLSMKRLKFIADFIGYIMFS